MTATKILWASLTGALSVIVLMVSAWAHDLNLRVQEHDQRLSTSEAHYAAIQADLQDLREHVKEIKSIIREQSDSRK